MATRREYAYYLKGDKIALIEKEMSWGDGQTLERPGLNDVGSTGNIKWVSPTASVVDALEIEYTYSPKYFIQTTNDVSTNITQYQSVDGKLAIADNTASYVNYATTYGLATGGGDYIILRKAGKFNGLHKISSIGNGPSGTNNKIILTTNYSGSEAAWTDFEERPDLYYAVDVLEDESDIVHIPDYLSKALVYYLKAKYAEDMGELKLREFFMREYKSMVEKFSNARTSGPHRMMTGSHSIR